MLTYMDVTSHKRAMAALYAAEQRHRRLLRWPLSRLPSRGCPTTVLSMPTSGWSTSSMPRRTSSIGQAAPDFYVNLEDRRRVLEMLRLTGRVSDLEVRMRTPTGREFWALIYAAIIDYEGQVAVLAAFNEITELKHREEQLV